MLRHRALELLALADPAAKCAAVHATDVVALLVDVDVQWEAEVRLPGRPLRPVLVEPGQVPRRAIGSLAGRRALIHALAHIEFNAINLALDIVWRFAALPEAFYRDWFTVAQEEASHFSLLCAHLGTLGGEYGDLPAHSGLWDMAEKTKDDVLARLALVGRTLEARGLDVSPALRDKLVSVGDAAGAAILERILQDEIGHVAIGSRWYHALCHARGLDPVVTHRRLQRQHDAPPPRGPFNLAARRQAGFTPDEIDALIAAEPDVAK